MKRIWLRLRCWWERKMVERLTEALFDLESDYMESKTALSAARNRARIRLSRASCALVAQERE